jgi:hypothetical protein
VLAATSISLSAQVTLVLLVALCQYPPVLLQAEPVVQSV